MLAILARIATVRNSPLPCPTGAVRMAMRGLGLGGRQPSGTAAILMGRRAPCRLASRQSSADGLRVSKCAGRHGERT